MHPFNAAPRRSASVGRERLGGQGPSDEVWNTVGV
jgi:hypothetical protein